jgi:D-xylose transport system substrate-binding protein
MVQSAQDAGAQVIAYDRLIKEADYYMSFDNETVGKMQAEALVEAMGDEGSILMLNGSPDDPNAAQFKAGAHSVLDASNHEILEEYDNPDWSPENAQSFVSDQLAKYDPSEINGVYAANDGQAGGVVAALTGGGVAQDALPPITGQDAEIAAIQRILAGEQAMTIYKPIPIEAETAAEVAVALANGDDVPTSTDTGVDQSDYEGVPSYIFDPTVVTTENVADTVIADGFYSAEDICTGEYAKACEAAGIS